MTVWFQAAPPPTARCLSPLPGRLRLWRALPWVYPKVSIRIGQKHYGFVHYTENTVTCYVANNCVLAAS